MLRRSLAGAVALALVTSQAAYAQQAISLDGAVHPSWLGQYTNSGCPSNLTWCFVPYTSGNPLPVSGSFSASLSGFAPTPAYATPLSVSTTSSRVALPTGAVVVVYNTGTTPAFTLLGNASVTATASDDAIPAGGWMAFTVGSNSYLAAITATGSTTLNISGGSGLPTGAGGGSGGGGGAVTGAAGSFVDGWNVTQGTKADSAWTSGSGSEIALLKAIAGTTAAPIATQAPTVSIGGTGIVDSAGSNVANVKAASTSAALADKGLVVAQSPNPAPQCPNVINISQTATTDVHTFTNIGYICSIVLVSATAQNIGVDEGTGTTCETSGTALIGVSSTASATPTMAVAANGGFSSVAASPWMKLQTSADHLCILQSGAGNVSGVITYADHS